MKFIVDCMHGKLARKMRIYGYDTVYENDLEDDEILNRAQREKRILLTSDEDLIQRAYSKNISVIRISLDNDLSRMTKIFKVLKVKPILRPKDSRCPHCNSAIKKIDKSEAKGVPDKILKRKRTFYKCFNCGKIYWYGSHWKKIREFEETLKTQFKHP